MIIADPDGDAKGEIVADFGTLGLWLWDTDVWTQLSGQNPETLLAGDLDADGQEEVLGDFGALGLWKYDSGDWTLLLSVNLD